MASTPIRTRKVLAADLKVTDVLVERLSSGDLFTTRGIRRVSLVNGKVVVPTTSGGVRRFHPTNLVEIQA